MPRRREDPGLRQQRPSTRTAVEENGAGADCDASLRRAALLCRPSPPHLSRTTNPTHHSTHHRHPCQRHQSWTRSSARASTRAAPSCSCRARCRCASSPSRTLVRAIVWLQLAVGLACPPQFALPCPQPAYCFAPQPHLATHPLTLGNLTSKRNHNNHNHPQLKPQTTEQPTSARSSRGARWRRRWAASRRRWSASRSRAPAAPARAA